jgi:hypothetical protein
MSQAWQQYGNVRNLLQLWLITLPHAQSKCRSAHPRGAGRCRHTTPNWARLHLGRGGFAAPPSPTTHYSCDQHILTDCSLDANLSAWSAAAAAHWACNKENRGCMRADLKPDHYMLPPYKGRRPDGHTRRPSRTVNPRTLPCFGQLLSVCGLCLNATAQPSACATGGARTRDLPPLLGHRI